MAYINVSAIRKAGGEVSTSKGITTVTQSGSSVNVSNAKEVTSNNGNLTITSNPLYDSTKKGYYQTTTTYENQQQTAQQPTQQAEPSSNISQKTSSPKSANLNLLPLTNPTNVLSKRETQTSEYLYAPIDKAPYKEGMAPNVYVHEQKGLVSTGNKINQTVVTNVNKGLASVSGTPYYEKTTEVKNGVETTTERVVTRAGLFETSESKISDNYRETIPSQIKNSVGFRQEPVLKEKSGVQKWSEKQGEKILNSRYVKTYDKIADEYTKSYFKYSPAGVVARKVTGKSSEDISGFYNDVRKNIQKETLKNPVKTGLLYAGSYAVGGGYTQFKSGLGATGLKISNTADKVLFGATVVGVSGGLISSKDKAEYLGKTISNFGIMGSGFSSGSELSAKYSTVQARALSIPKKVDIKISPLNTKKTMTLKEPRGIVDEEGVIIGINKKQPAMINTIKYDKNIGSIQQFKGKNYQSDVINVGDKSSITVKRKFAGKDFVTKINAEGEEGTLQVFNKNMKPIGVKSNFNAGNSNLVGVSDVYKIGSVKNELFKNKVTGERNIITSDTYRQDVISKSKDVSFNRKNLDTTVKSQETFRLGRLDKMNNKVSNVLPSKTQDLNKEYIMTAEGFEKQYKGRRFIDNRIVLSNKAKYPKDVYSLRTERSNPTVFRNTDIKTESDLTNTPKSSINKANIIINKKNTNTQFNKQNIKTIRESNKGVNQELLSRTKTETIQKVNQKSALKSESLIPKYDLKLYSGSKTVVKTQTIPVLKNTSNNILKSENRFNIINKNNLVNKQSKILQPKSEVLQKQNVRTDLQRISLSQQIQKQQSEVPTNKVFPSLVYPPYNKPNIRTPKPSLPIPSGGFGAVKGMSVKGFKQKKDYTPSFFAIGLNIRGKKLKKQSGLDIRPIQM